MRLTEPSERNWEMFLAVEHEGASLRAVARKYRVSPTRVTQIIEQVRRWFTETTPAWVFERRSEVQPLVACRMHEAKLGILEGRLHRSWRKSLRGEQSARQVEGEMRKVIVTRYRHGDVRFLMAIVKVSAARISACERTHGAMQAFQASYGSPKEALLSLAASDHDDDENETSDSAGVAEDPSPAACDAPAADEVEDAAPIQVAPIPCAPAEEGMVPEAAAPASDPPLTADGGMTSEDFLARAFMRRALQKTAETPVRAPEPKRLSRQAKEALKRARKRRKLAS